MHHCYSVHNAANNSHLAGCKFAPYDKSSRLCLAEYRRSSGDRYISSMIIFERNRIKIGVLFFLQWISAFAQPHAMLNVD
jgi:hypothetical protein